MDTMSNNILALYQHRATLYSGEKFDGRLHRRLNYLKVKFKMREVVARMSFKFSTGNTLILKTQFTEVHVLYRLIQQNSLTITVDIKFTLICVHTT